MNLLQWRAAFAFQPYATSFPSRPVVSVDGFAPSLARSPAPAPTQNWAVQNPPQASGNDAEVFATLERLAELLSSL